MLDNNLKLGIIKYADAKSLNRDLLYLRMADIWSNNSVATRAKVGALIVKDNLIVSDGYNGMPKAFPNCCEHSTDTGDLATNKEVLHAESNALTKLVKYGGTGTKDAIMYCTFSPCIECSKLIVQSGIVQVHFLNFYHNIEGLQLLVDAGIECFWHDDMTLQNKNALQQQTLDCLQNEWILEHINHVQHVDMSGYAAGRFNGMHRFVDDKQLLVIDMSLYKTAKDDMSLLSNTLLSSMTYFNVANGVQPFNCYIGFIDMNGCNFGDLSTYDKFVSQMIPLQYTSKQFMGGVR